MLRAVCHAQTISGSAFDSARDNAVVCSDSDCTAGRSWVHCTSHTSGLAGPRSCAAQEDVLSESSTPSELPSSIPSTTTPLGEAPRSGSNAAEVRAQQELGNAVGTAIGKPRVASRTMMSPQQQAQEQQKTQEVRGP